MDEYKDLCYSNRRFAEETVRRWNMSDDEFILANNTVRRIYSIQLNKIYGYRTRTPSEMAVRNSDNELNFFGNR